MSDIVRIKNMTKFDKKGDTNKDCPKCPERSVTNSYYKEKDTIYNTTSYNISNFVGNYKYS